MSPPLSPELTLAAACCRWPPSARRDEAVRAATGRGVDWDRFEAVISRHRIRPLVSQALRRAQVTMPELFDQRLAFSAVKAGRRSLLQARESIHLQQAFVAQGVPAMIIKGVPLALLAYGELGMKESADIDLLVSPDTAAHGRELLMGLGYIAELDKLGPREFEGYARHFNEAAFLNAQSGMKVDLHWRLVPHRAFFAGIGANSSAQEVILSGAALKTLADEPLFAYLCVHGALHNWFRLKWLADIGALLAPKPPTEVVRLYDAAVERGAGRCASVALLLCNRLLGLSLDERLLSSLKQDRVAKALERNVLAALSYGDGTVEPDPFTVPWLRLTAAQFFLAPGAGHGFDQLRVFWNSPTDRAVFLPRGLEFCYHFIRVPLWLGRIGARALERKRT